MKTPTFEDSIEALKCLRMEMQGRVEDSVMTKLDEIIHDLEQAEAGHGRALTTADVLRLVGAGIELIPAVAKMIEWLQAMK